jgi:integrase
LWPETVKAIKELLAKRTKPKNPDHARLLFITKYGGSGSNETSDNPVSKEFRKLVDELELHWPGLGFYELRHGFETFAGESRYQVTVDAIMARATVNGHVRSLALADQR